MPEISVVIPVYNEESVLPELFRRLFLVLNKLNVVHEVVMIDDGSGDGTWELLTESLKSHKELKLIRFSRNFGHQAAVSAGLAKAKGRVVVVMDADLQDPPELIPEFYKKFNEGGCDVVYAIRENRKESLWKRLCYKSFYRVLRRIVSEADMILDSGDFSLVSQRVAKIVTAMPEHNRYIRGLRSWTGFRQTGVHYSRDLRAAGKTKYSFAKLMRLGYDGIFSFSYFPITVLGYAAIIMFLLSVGGVIYSSVMADFMVMDTRMAVSIMTLVSSLLMFAMWVLGNYLRRVYDEGKQRPLYIISETRELEHV